MPRDGVGRELALGLRPLALRATRPLPVLLRRPVLIAKPPRSGSRLRQHGSDEERE
jgi:hypothetical protein